MASELSKAEHDRRQRGLRDAEANLRIEGIFLTAEDKALFARADREGLSDAETRALILEDTTRFIRQRQLGR